MSKHPGSIDSLILRRTTRCRFILSELVADKLYAPKAADGNFSFMRTNAAYKRSMEIAYKRWRWVEKRLNK